MIERKRRKRFLEKIRSRYRLIIYNDTTYQTVWTLRLTPLKVFTLISLLSAVMIGLVVFLVASTPLRVYIPGYPDPEEREMLLRNVILVDSLEEELSVRDQYFEDLKTILSGKVPAEPPGSPVAETTREKAAFRPYNSDSVFQDKILEERLSFSEMASREQAGPLEQIHFYPPVKGLVTNQYHLTEQHFGVDLVAQPNSRISAVLEGVVIFAGWTLETGLVIYIQHSNNLVSAYKHNAELLKQPGELVNAGEAIAIIGNSGELSTGPHLHFELWHNGKAVDPEKYIVF